MKKQPAYRRPGMDLTPEELAKAKNVFLEAFAHCGVILVAANKARVSRVMIYRWLENDPEFKQRYDAAKEDADDVVRYEIWRRGVEGYSEQTTEQQSVDGVKIKVLHKYSDNMLHLLAQSRMRAEFASRTDITSNDQSLVSGEAIGDAVRDPQIAALADELLARIAGAPREE